MTKTISTKLNADRRRKMEIWLLSLAVVMSGVSLLTHVASSFAGEQLNGAWFNPHVYGFELALVCGASLLLLTFAIDDHRINKRRRDEALHEDVIREHNGVLKGQAKALDAHAMVSISLPSGQLLSANENFREFFEYTQDALNKATNDQIYPDGINNPTHKAVSEAMRAGKTWQGKQSLVKLNGEPVTVFSTIIPVQDAAGHRTHNICIRTDITEMDRSERQRMLSELMGDLQEEVYVYEVDTLAMIYANKAARVRCNWSTADITNLTIADSSQNFVTEMFQEHTKPLFEGTQETVTIRTMHEKGPVEITTRTVLTPAGKHVFVSVLRDVSEQHRVEKARLESLSEASHELRSPLTSIKGSLKLLEAGVVGPLPDKANELVSVARRNTDRLIGMVNNVLDYEKLKSGTMDMERCPIDLKDVLRKSVEMMDGYSGQQDVDIQLDLPEHVSLVDGNEDRLVQVVVNLISNAVKHSPKEGVVVAKVTEIDDCYRVTVEDEGPGVPDEAKERIFESFGQVDALDGIKRHGTGLGLAISQKILRMHSTKMDLATGRARGSEFYFDLPKMDTISKSAA